MDEIDSLNIDDNDEEDVELSDSYLEEKLDDSTYECVSDSLLFILHYTHEKDLPIAETLTFSDLFEFLFE